uniref:Uncharacterized protein n=1 Tax=Anopheles culicifacies TaxID=139723 RepID=A0A182LZ31_9DIPT
MYKCAQGDINNCICYCDQPSTSGATRIAARTASGRVHHPCATTRRYQLHLNVGCRRYLGVLMFAPMMVRLDRYLGLQHNTLQFRCLLMVMVMVVMCMGLREHEERLLFSTIGLPDDSLLMRFGGGEGVEMRFAYCSGMISAPGPTKLSRIGKKNSPLKAPIRIAESSNQKKCRTTNSNEDVESIKMASADVTTP